MRFTFINMHLNTSTRRVTIALWLFGLLCAAVLTYTTRYYLNSDGLTYLEMAEHLREGRPEGIVNLGTSPLYAILLAAGGAALDTTRADEVPLLKIVNFAIFAGALAACAFFLSSLRRALDVTVAEDRRRLPDPLLTALGYGAFLVAALTWVRIRLVNPDMLLFLFFLLGMGLILRIRTEPDRFRWYAMLGVTFGLGYLSKTFFLPLSCVMLAAAACSPEPLRRGLPRLATTVVVTALIAAPFIAALSERAGKFSIGEIGSHAYATEAQSEGRPIHIPAVLRDDPRVLLYDLGIPATDHRGFDVAHWTLGLDLSTDMSVMWNNIRENIGEFFGHSPWFFIVCGIWFIAQVFIGSVRPGRLWPVPIPVLLAIPSLAGIGAYVLVHLEARYVASFVFVGFMALVAWPRYDLRDPVTVSKTRVGAILLALCFVGVTAASAMDQSISGLVSAGRKLSPLERFQEHIAVKEFLRGSGVDEGEIVAAVDSPPIYWARLAGVQIKGRVAGNEEFLEASPIERRAALDALANAGVTAVIAHGKGFERLKDEGWTKAPGTRSYYVRILDRSDGATKTGDGHPQNQ